MNSLLLVLVVAVAVWATFRALSRPALVVELGGDTARVVRGAPPPGLVSDLREVQRLSGGAEGRVVVRGSGASLDLRTPGLDDSTRQRVRNVVMLYRDRI